ncbi:MAG: hypothetical protein SWK90_19080 [Chloroflexota bacterium]|nr:hypothetical protein [Chloroflexota bacterium]
MRRSKTRRTRIMLWVISLLIIASMGLSMVAKLVPPRPPTPTLVPTFTSFPTRTPTPTPG